LITACCLSADASPEVLQQQLQTFLQSLDISDPSSAADDAEYQEFVTGEPHQAVSHIDWAAELQQPAAHRQHPLSQSWQEQHQSEAEQQGYADAWHAAEQATKPGAKPSRPALEQPSADAFQQSQQPGHTDWADDFARHHQQAAAAQQPNEQNPDSPWIAEYHAQQQQIHPANQRWTEQFLSGDDEAWAEQVHEQTQLAEPQLSPEERKALKDPHPDDPLDDKAALSWVRQFNEEAAKPSINFGNGDALPSIQTVSSNQPV